jgi:hypothetical protein
MNGSRASTAAGTLALLLALTPGPALAGTDPGPYAVALDALGGLTLGQYVAGHQADDARSANLL